MTENLSVKEVFTLLVENELQTKKDVTPLVPAYHAEKVSMVSLFCGAGGFEVGFEWAGIEAVLSRRIDIHDKNLFDSLRGRSLFKTVYALDFFYEALETYAKYFTETTIQCANIRHLQSFPIADIYSFGFPCPGFSSAGPRNLKDERNYLYVHCCRALQEAQPSFFIAENVPGMLTLQKGEVFAQIEQDFKDCGYRTYTKVVNARDYGVAQLRERVIIVGVRNDIPFQYVFPRETHGGNGLPYVTLKECIGELNDNSNLYYEGSYSSQYMSRNRKKDWDDQSFTIQASARQAPMHPSGLPMKRINGSKWEFEGDHNRRLSVREAARIQSFPDWYEFSQGKRNSSHNTLLERQFKQIGNAVPPLLAKVIIQPIANYFLSKR
ncbi:DNA cytosine methyltransferase [Lysinibacillus sp. UGB7]|uniref:DNA cytosine methyltransferase n=1 Tax=Lysinibacillus sp. UGB7 TaxID=3411039 RepID=UPI003B7632A8